MGFRVAIGSCRCADGIRRSDPHVRQLCGRLLTRVERLRAWSYEVLTSLPRIASDRERIEGRVVVLNTYRDTLETGDTLIVVQGFMRSWRFPNYLGSAGIGHMFAEGILVGVDRQIIDAPEHCLLEFR